MSQHIRHLAGEASFVDTATCPCWLYLSSLCQGAQGLHGTRSRAEGDGEPPHVEKGVHQHSRQLPALLLWSPPLHVLKPTTFHTCDFEHNLSYTHL